MSFVVFYLYGRFSDRTNSKYLFQKNYQSMKDILVQGPMQS